MKKLIYSLSMVALSLQASAQVYVDPTTSVAMASQSLLINNQLDKSNEKLTLIQRAQLAVTGELAVVNDLQSRIYRGLSEVSSAVSSLLAVKDIYEISEDILLDGKKAIAIATKNPALLLFAQSGANEFYSRAMSLSAQVSSFVLKGGGDNLMDAGERAKLLGRITTELAILRGVVYGMYRAMYWASVRGFWNSLNPYSGFINLDKQIADQVIAKSKLIGR